MVYSTGQRYCSASTHAECAQYGGITHMSHAKYTCVIIFTNCYTNLNYPHVQFVCILSKEETSCINTPALNVLFSVQISNGSRVKDQRKLAP